MRHETYDREGNLLEVSEVSEVSDIAIRLSPLEIIGLFTATELAAIEKSESLQVVVFRTSLFAATTAVSLDDQRFTGAISLFQSLSILTPERAERVLTGQAP